MKIKMSSSLVVIVLLVSGCSSSPMDLCKQLAGKGLVTKCHEDSMESKVSEGAAFVGAENDFHGRLTVYKNDDEYNAACDPKGDWTLATNPKVRACVDSDIGFYSFGSIREETRQAKQNAPFMAKLKEAVAALK